jgi:hypothetical protein
LKNIAFIFCLILAHFVNAQVQWAKQIGSSSLYDIENAQIISDGVNIYMIGSFEGSLFLPNDTLYANGSEDIFIAKFDANGSNLWSKNIGGNANTTMDYESANGVYDPVNHCIYLSGHFVNNFYFPGVGYITGNSDIFLAKMDLDGNFIWAKKAGGNGHDGAQVYVNPFGKIYLVTQSTDSAYFDNFHIGSGGAIVTFDDLGVCLSAEVKYNTNIFSEFNSVRLNFIEKDLIFYGTFITSTFTLDTTLTNSLGDKDAFIARADSTGKVKWLKRFQSEGRESINKVCINSNFDIAFLGDISDTLDILGINIPIAGYDILVATIDQNGNLKWIKKMNINSNTLVVGLDVKLTTSNNVVVSGFFNSICNFESTQIISNTVKDMFVVKFDTTGAYLSHFNFGIATGGSLYVDNSNNLYVCGNFSNTVNIGNNNFTVYGGSSDIYLAKFNASLGNNTRTAPNNTLIIYANPTKGTCNITVPADLKSSPNLTLMIYNAQGSLIQKQQIQQLQDKIKLNLEAEAKGVYNVSLGDGYRMYYGKIVFE